MGYFKMSVLMMMVVAIGVAEGQSTPSCAQKLVPCANYINATNPPAECCDSLKEAVTQELDCICNLYNTPGLLASLYINVTEAVTLPGRCNIPGDISACPNATAPTSSVSPPGVPGGDNSGVGRIACIGLSSLLLFWASMMLLY